MIRSILLSVLVLCLPAWAQAATYYLDDAGSNANAGTSTGAPWLTWAHAFAKSACGDMLIVKNGTYTTATHGNPNLSARVCTVGKPFTIRAENERQAFISGNGSNYSFRVQDSAYVIVEGLRIKGADSSESGDSTVRVNNSHHITFRRNIVTHNNRYFNEHLLQLTDTTTSLLEENEFYFFHRHAIILNRADNIVVRRNYCHARAYADIAGGYQSSPAGTGDDCIVIYPGSNNTIENNIAEGSMLKMGAIEAISTSTGNKFYGNIAIGTTLGIALDARGATATLMPQNTLIRDFVAIDSTDTGVRSNGAKNTYCNHCYVFSSANNGFSAGFQPGGEGDGIMSFFADNSMANTNTSTGFLINDAVGTWTIRTSNSFNNSVNYSPATSTNLSTNPRGAVNPVMGTCRVWVPDGSPMKGAGFDGSDIGANILYRYQNGALTNVPLWNPTTGEFPHGALVAGLNDVAGQSLFDVHRRLNVNTNGCSFPANYGSGVTDVKAPATPGNLSVF